jgi:hypothetical protein
MLDGPILSPGSIVGGRDVGAFIRGRLIGLGAELIFS